MNRPASVALRRLPALMLAALVLTGCASAGTPAISEGDIEQRVAQARTSEQHLGLATYFEAHAAAAEHEADECRKLRRSYERTPQSLYSPIGMAPAMLSHYDQLIQNHQRNAAEYRALAQLHRSLAGRPADAGSNN